METLRKRIPFKLNANEEEDDNRIYDEQEQEGIVDDLRRETDAANARYLQYMQALVGLSLLLHIVLLIDPGAVLAAEGELTPRVLALAHVLLHANLLLLCQRRGVVRAPVRSVYALALSLVAPVCSVLLLRPWRQTMVYGAAGLVAGVVHAGLGWMAEGERAITELERLRYAAKGA